jgi:hypothetical protein
MRLAQKGDDGIDLAEGPIFGTVEESGIHVKRLKTSLVFVHPRGRRAADLVGSHAQEDSIEDAEGIRVAHFETADEEGIDDDNRDTVEEEE